MIGSINNYVCYVEILLNIGIIVLDSKLIYYYYVINSYYNFSEFINYIEILIIKGKLVLQP